MLGWRLSVRNCRCITVASSNSASYWKHQQTGTHAVVLHSTIFAFLEQFLGKGRCRQPDPSVPRPRILGHGRGALPGSKDTARRPTNPAAKADVFRQLMDRQSGGCWIDIAWGELQFSATRRNYESAQQA